MMDTIFDWFNKNYFRQRDQNINHDRDDSFYEK